MTEEQKAEWRTAITDTSDPDKIVCRGYNLNHLILNDKIDFGAVWYLMMTGRLPTKGQAIMMNGLLKAVIDHGIAPSEICARYIAASGVPFQACLAGGLLTIGDVHGGAGEEMARFLQEKVKSARERGISMEEAADEIMAEAKAAGKRVDGYGHPLHPNGDPRGDALLSLAERAGVYGDHCRLARALEQRVMNQVTKSGQKLGKRAAINIDGACAACMLDIGIDWRYARALICTSRATGLSAHIVEEKTRERGWRIPPKYAYDGAHDLQVPDELPD